MAEPLKRFFDTALIESLAAALAGAYPQLDRRRFVADGRRGLQQLELMARGTHLAEVMARHLPVDYPSAVAIVLASLGHEPEPAAATAMAPFRYLPHLCFVARYGLDHFEASMHAQHVLTQRFTAEASIRPFLIQHPERTLAQLERWVSDPSAHVRRLVSEGTRPRLPWAPRLREFQRDPAPVLALLERLKDDPERYVQRSVANNLNDIAKDHPETVVEVCLRWSQDAGEGRRWIIRHALRSLVKRGHRGALGLLGAGARPRVQLRGVSVSPARARRGGQVSIAFELQSSVARAQDLLVDYAVHFVKADGKRRPKVFKLRRVQLPARGAAQLQARISLADLTTRKHYPGLHAVELLVNGVKYALCEFEVA